MGEHAATGLEKWLMNKTGKDIYFWNFIALMVLTVIEVAAVYIDWVKVLDTTLENAKLLTWAILIGVGLIKVYGMSVSDFLKYINSAVFKSKHEKLSEILEVIAKYDYRILVGANSEIQLSAMLAELAKIEK